MILSISDIKTEQVHTVKIGFVYLIISIFCVLFGAVYEHFSHEVYSGYMIYAFLFPLLGGTLPFYGMSLLFCPLTPERLTLNLYNSGIATLTVGSILKGVLEIYGTTNSLVRIYWVVGIGLTGMGILLYLIEVLQSKKNRNR